jgi:glyceraldehyde-3-phosphate dehydrogenase/erythrose-4-phosphate dehydrogenase
MRVGIAGYGVVGKTRHASISKNTSFQIVASQNQIKKRKKYSSME